MAGTDKMKKRAIIIFMLIFVLPSAILTGCSKEQEMDIGQPVKIERGDLRQTVAADGSLVMPQQVELRFGTIGAVTEVLVEEGDKVKEGALLARLDNTSQKNAIKTALYDIQLARNDLAEQGPLQCRKLAFPSNYPNTSALRIFEQAQKDFEESWGLIEEGYYKEAAAKLRMTQSDLEVCAELLDAIVTNMKTDPASALTPTYEEKPDIPDDEHAFLDVTKVLDHLQQTEESLGNIQQLIGQGAYSEIAAALSEAQEDMITSYQAVKSSPGQTVRFSLSYPDVATGMDFLQLAESSLLELRERMEQDDFNAVEFAETLRLAQLDLQISHDILENNEVIFESGLNPKEVQQYNLNLQNAELDLQKARSALTKTEILAPFDGTVVDIGVEAADVLSAIDYSARTAVTLVNTSTIKLEGIIDEVDIFKVEVGQKAVITVDALPDKEFTGTVSFISPFGSEEASGVIRFDVTVELDPTEIELRGGLTATAEILVTNRKNVLLIPTGAIIATPMGEIAMVVNETTMQPEMRRLEIGTRSYQFAEVVSGIEEGEKVLLIDKEAMEARRSQMESGGGDPHGPSPGRGFLR